MSTLHHRESEQAVLGGLLLDPAAFERIEHLVEADFYADEHRYIFRHIVAMLAQNRPVDVVTVAESIDAAGDSERTGGLAYLGELAANTPSAANIRHYAETVIEKRGLRDLLAAASAIADLAQGSSPTKAEERIEEAQALVFGLTERSERNAREPVLAASLLSDAVANIEARINKGGAIVGLPTGFDDLDAMTAGFQPSDLVVIAGRPGMGKSALALNIAESVAVNEGLPVLVFSMEMGVQQLLERSMASLGHIDMAKIRSGQLSESDWDRLSSGIGKIFNSKLILDDSPGLGIAQIRARTRRTSRKHGKIGLVVIDYIQLARGEGQNREQEIASISRGLKALAKEFHCPVIALSQLSRKVEDRADKRPMMSDLRESGAIEQDADVIMMLYREEYYKPETPDNGIAECIIAKQRMGETGIVHLAFHGKYSRFSNLGREDKAEAAERRKRAHHDQSKAKPSRGFLDQ